MHLRRVATTLLAGFVSLGFARAQTHHDSGLWTMIFAQGDLGEDLQDLRWWFDLQPRFTEDEGGLDQLLIRPGLGYAVQDNATAWLGYAWIKTAMSGSGHSEENRLWQQWLWVPKIEAFGLQSRTRLEQRWLDTGDDVGWRFRQFAKWTYPFEAAPRVFLSVYDEVFFDLNDTDWGQRAGFTQNRLFAGLGWKLDEQATANLEVGYLNQFTNRRGTDEMNHILSINLFLNF